MARQHRILVAEDEKQWREDIFREALEDAGYQVVTSSNYAEAIAALDRQVFDLAVIDVNLTGVPGNQDGLRILEQMAALGHDSPSIIVSGSKSRALDEDSIKEFLPLALVDKTEFDVAEFVTLVAKAFAREPEGSCRDAIPSADG